MSALPAGAGNVPDGVQPADYDPPELLPDSCDSEPNDDAMEACTWKTRALVNVDREAA